MKEYDITNEEYRHYTIYSVDGIAHGIHITNPVSLFYESGHQFHRVWDGSVVTLAPAPGPLLNEADKVIGWVELSWCPKDKNNPVAF